LSSTNDATVKRYALPGVPTPVLPADIPNKAYVDAAIAAINQSVWTLTEKTADQTVVSSTVLVTDPDLQIVGLSGEQFLGQIHLMVESAAAPDFKSTMTVTAGTADGAVVDNSLNFTQLALGVTTASSGASWPMHIIVFFAVIFTSDGTISLQFAQNASSATPTIVRKGSFLLSRKID